MTAGQPRPCETPFSGGNTCVCNCDPAHPHVLHVCRDKACQCHAAAAQHMELVTDRNGDPYYVPQGARLVVRRGTA